MEVEVPVIEIVPQEYVLLVNGVIQSGSGSGASRIGVILFEL